VISLDYDLADHHEHLEVSGKLAHHVNLLDVFHLDPINENPEAFIPDTSLIGAYPISGLELTRQFLFISLKFCFSSFIFI
jgi:hypothetical protein